MTIPKARIEAARHQVEKLAQLGCTDKEISTIVSIPETSLKTHLRKELTNGRDNMRASLRKAQLQTAIEGKNPSMLIWMGKCYLGQKEPKHNIEHSGGVTVEKVMFGSNVKKD